MFPTASSILRENVEPDWYEIPSRDKMSSVISAALLPAAPSLP